MSQIILYCNRCRLGLIDTEVSKEEWNIHCQSNGACPPVYVQQLFGKTIESSRTQYNLWWGQVRDNARLDRQPQAMCPNRMEDPHLLPKGPLVNNKIQIVQTPVRPSHPQQISFKDFEMQPNSFTASTAAAAAAAATVGINSDINNNNQNMTKEKALQKLCDKRKMSKMSNSSITRAVEAQQINAANTSKEQVSSLITTPPSKVSKSSRKAKVVVPPSLFQNKRETRQQLKSKAVFDVKREAVAKGKEWDRGENSQGPPKEVAPTTGDAKSVQVVQPASKKMPRDLLVGGKRLRIILQREWLQRQKCLLGI